MASASSQGACLPSCASISIMALALPCRLIIPQKGGLGSAPVPPQASPLSLLRGHASVPGRVYALSLSTSPPPSYEHLEKVNSLSLCFPIYEMGTVSITPTSRFKGVKWKSLGQGFQHKAWC